MAFSQGQVVLPQFAAWPEVSVADISVAAQNQNKPTLAKNTPNGVTAGNITVATARRLFLATVTNPGANNYFLQIFDAAAQPVDGTTPLVSIPCNAGTNQYFESTSGYPLQNGLVACVSTTQGTLTIGSADCVFAVTYSE